MAIGGKTPPAGLSQQQAKALLDKLETDHDFRTQFEQSPEQALRSVGYTDSATCLTLKPGTKLASPEQIKAKRHKLEAVMVGIQAQDCGLSDQEGG